jgi:hypothetical protein
LTAIDKNLTVDLGADYLVGALRNGRTRPPFTLGMGSRCQGKRDSVTTTAALRP